jgi:hypothetical protein
LTNAGGIFTAAETQGLRQLFGQGPAGAQMLLDQLAKGAVPLPPCVTTRTLENYATVARTAIRKGMDKIGTQALRLQAIQRLLGQ